VGEEQGRSQGQASVSQVIDPQGKSAMNSITSSSKEQLSRAITKVNDGISQLLLDLTAAQKVLGSYKDSSDSERLVELKKLLGSLVRGIVQTTRSSPIVLDLYAESLKTASGWVNRRWNIYATEEARRSRFEEGKPADPTQNMNPEDSKKWKEMNDEHKDNFKSAAEGEDPLSRYRLEIDAAIETLKVLKKKKPQASKRQLFIILQSIGNAIGQLEEDGKNALSDVFFTAANKVNTQWSASDFANYKK